MNESQVFYILRAVAIFSVLCAHSSYVSDSSQISLFFSRLLLLYGLAGVPIFFINSGYYFYSRQITSYKIFLNKKTDKIIIPWVFLTTIVYLYIALRKEGLDLGNYIYFIIGLGNYTYFLSVLMILYMFFLKSRFSNFLIIFGVLFSILSMGLTTTGHLSFIDPYINPFNWLLYFLLGIIIRKFDLLFKIIFYVKPYRYYLLMILCLLSLFATINGFYPYYWNIIAYFFIPIFIITTVSFLYKYHTIFRSMIGVGKKTLPIYLIHSLFVGGIVYFTNYYSLVFFVPFRPLITLLVTLAAIYIYTKLIRILNIEKIGLVLMGL
jgi:surface polysaccharide O-acyltransferase-like enzyme